MKKLVAIAIGLLFTGAAASWALVGVEKISYDGSLEVKGISANNEIDFNNKVAQSDHRGEVNTRVRLGIQGDLTEGVLGRVEFGRTGSTYGRNYAGATGASNSIDNETANIRVDNAYVELADLLSLNVRLGRQYVGNANDLVWFIGPRQGDAMAINAIDGLLLGKKWDMVEASLFLGKAVKEDGQGSTNQDLANGDVNLNSLDVVIPKLVPDAKITVGYVWGVLTSTSPRDSLNIMRVGIAGNVQENLLTYKAEYLANSGEDKIPAGTKVKYEGTALDLGLGVNIPENEAGKISLAAGYLLASGDNTADNKDKSFHDFSILGVASSDRYYGQIVGKNDIWGAPGIDSGAQGPGNKILNIGLEYLPKMVKNTSLKIDYYNFKSDKSVLGDDTNPTSPKTSEFGQEIDVTLGYKVSDNVDINGGYANYKPGKGVVGYDTANARWNKRDAVTEWFANAAIKWGSAE